MTKVAINNCWGGFDISSECLDLYNKMSGKKEKYGHNIERDDPNLIKAIEQIGEDKASDRLSKIKIIEIPDGIEYEIDDYDGMESIHESHRSWN